MRELDALLLAFVDQAAATMTDDEMTAFEAILELPDPVLHAYVLGRSAPAESTTAALIGRIQTSLSPDP
jgi:antitoxin CptB